MTENNDVILAGLQQLVLAAGENSRDHGFHEDWPEPDERMEHQPSEREIEEYRTQVRRAITEKLDLIHEEVSEALGEIRSGHEPGKVYYSKTTKLHAGSKIIDVHHEQVIKDGVPTLKPEGFAIELADAVIRIADLAYKTGIDLPGAVIEKHLYNATRPHKHGRMF